MTIDPEALQDVAFAANDPRSKYWRMFKLIDRGMAFHCDPVEYRILLFVLERTYAFGKEREHIPEYHFLHGVEGPTGMLHAPINIGRSKLYDSIKKLQSKGMLYIIRQGTRSAPIYVLNSGWSFDNVSKGRGMSSINMPKNKRDKSATRTNQSVIRTNLSAERTNESAIRTPNITTDINHRLQPSVLSAREAIQQATVKNADARARQKVKDTASAILKHWQDTWAEAYPDDPPVAVLEKEVFALRQALKRIPVAEHRIPMLVWSIQNYREVIKTKFSFMLKGGRHDRPHAFTLVSRISDFYASYLDAISPNRKLDRRIRETSTEQTPEQKQIAQLREQVRILEQSQRGVPVHNVDAEVKTKRAIQRRQSIKRIVLDRKSGPSEFGEWGDKD